MLKCGLCACIMAAFYQLCSHGAFLISGQEWFAPPPYCSVTLTTLPYCCLSWSAVGEKARTLGLLLAAGGAYAAWQQLPLEQVGGRGLCLAVFFHACITLHWLRQLPPAKPAVRDTSRHLGPEHCACLTHLISHLNRR